MSKETAPRGLNHNSEYKTYAGEVLFNLTGPDL